MCVLRSQQPRHLNVWVAFRRYAPNKGLHPLRRRRHKVRSSSFPPYSENCAHSLAPPLPTKSYDFAGTPLAIPAYLGNKRSFANRIRSPSFIFPYHDRL